MTGADRGVTINDKAVQKEGRWYEDHRKVFKDGDDDKDDSDENDDDSDDNSDDEEGGKVEL